MKRDLRDNNADIEESHIDTRTVRLKADLANSVIALTPETCCKILLEESFLRFVGHNNAGRASTIA